MNFKFVCALALSAIGLSCGTNNQSEVKATDDVQKISDLIANHGMSPEIKKYFKAPQEFLRATATVLTAEMVKSDSEFLAIMLTNVYTGGSGIDHPLVPWAQIFSRVGEKARTMSSSEWQMAIQEALRDNGPRDSHLALYNVQQGGALIGYRPVFLPADRYEADSTCQANSAVQQNYYADGMTTIGRRSVVVADSTPVLDNCVWKKSPHTSPEFSKEPTARSLTSSINIVHAHDFSNRDIAMWKQFNSTWNALPDVKNIVIDMRSNAGGDDIEFYDWLRNVIEKLPAPYIFKKKSGGFSFITEFNNCSKGLALGRANPECMEFMLGMLKDIPAGGTIEDVAGFEFTDVDQSKAQLSPGRKLENGSTVPFDGRFIVLVDRFCASACELALKSLKLLPNTIVVGEKTAGMALYDMNNVNLLPGSGVAITFANAVETDLLKNTIGFKEGYGIMPDIWLAPGSVKTDELIINLVKVIRSFRPI